MKLLFEGAVLALLLAVGFAALVDLGEDAHLAEANQRAAVDATPHLVVGTGGEAHWVGWSDSCEALWVPEGEEARGSVGTPECSQRVWPHIATTRQPGGGPHSAAAHQDGD